YLAPQVSTEAGAEHQLISMQWREVASVVALADAIIASDERWRGDDDDLLSVDSLADGGQALQDQERRHAATANREHAEAGWGAGEERTCCVRTGVRLELRAGVHGQQIRPTKRLLLECQAKVLDRYKVWC